MCLGLGVLVFGGLGLGAWWSAAPGPTPALGDLVTVSGTLGDVRVQTLRGTRERVVLSLQQQPWSFSYSSDWPQYAALRSLVGRTGQATIWTAPRELNAGSPVRIWQLSLDGQTIVDYQHTAPVFAAADRSGQWTPLVIVVWPALFVILSVALVPLHLKGRDVAHWRITLNGQPTAIAVRFSPVRGPSVLVDGLPVEAVQEPTWGRYPNAARRTFTFRVREHPATIVETVPTLLSTSYARFDLEVAGQHYAPAGDLYSASWLGRSKR